MKEQHKISNDADWVSQSIEAHGGINTWKNLKNLSYQKTTILYDSTGKEESRTIQEHNYYFQPDSGSIRWRNQDGNHLIRFQDNKAWKSIDGVVQVEVTDSISALNAWSAAQYILFQPFKLSEVDLLPVASTMIGDSLEVNVIQPVYGDEEDGGDKWWFYIHPDTRQVVSNLVRHDGRFSYIDNLEMDSTTGLVLHKHRKSYFTDSLRNIKYLRAEYFYENYKAKYLTDE